MRTFWLHHLNLVWSGLTSEAKLSYLHRLFMPVGYAAFLDPLVLAIGIPSLALILLSYEPHMYGGLAHYSTELVPVVLVGTILGIGWLKDVAAPRLGISPRWLTLGIMLYVLGMSLANARANGFTPLSVGFHFPAITAHQHLVNTAIALIPDDASVSVEDVLDPHVSGRDAVYLFPDTDYGRADYVLLDATTSQGATMKPCDLARLVTGDNSGCYLSMDPGQDSATHQQPFDQYALLPSGRWTIAFAQDGILLLRRRQPGVPLSNILPPAFFSFTRPSTTDQPQYRVTAQFGQYFALEGYAIDRRETTNLRNPDIVVTSWWKVLAPPPSDVELTHYVSDPSGALQTFSRDQQVTDWIPPYQWQTGHVYKVQSSQLSVTTQRSGLIDVDLGWSMREYSSQDISHNLTVRVNSSNPTVSTHGGGKLLRIARIHAVL